MNITHTQEKISNEKRSSVMPKRRGGPYWRKTGGQERWGVFYKKKKKIEAVETSRHTKEGHFLCARVSRGSPLLRHRRGTLKERPLALKGLSLLAVMFTPLHCENFSVFDPFSKKKKENGRTNRKCRPPLFNTIHYNIKEVLSLFFPDQQNNMVVSYWSHQM